MKKAGNYFGTEGAKPICEALMINTTLVKLNLYCKEMQGYESKINK